MLNPGYPDFWVLVSFVLFIGLLAYYGVPGLIGKALDARAEQIRKELDEARRLREEAQELLADYQRKAREAEDEARAIVDTARREAEALAAETRANLKETLERRGKLAEDKIARAEAQALAEVKAAAIDQATAAAETVIKQRLAGQAGNAMVDSSIRDLKARLN